MGKVLLGRRGLALLCSALLLLAQATAAQEADSADQVLAQAISAAGDARIAGPTDVALAGQATLKLPAGYAFVPVEAARALLEAMGNQVGEGFLGLIVGDALQGFVSVRYDAAGYIEDSDAREWNADELLQSLKDGTEAGNAERRDRGLPEFIVAGWVEPPRYDAAQQRLVWSAELRAKGAPDSAEASVNYNTYQLGREGYISMNLVTDMASVEAQKPLAHELLAQLSFDAGKRYADFDPATDKVAAYGLAALVGGLAAKKLGLLAMGGLLLAKFGKVIALAAVGGAAVLARVFSRRKS